MTKKTNYLLWGLQGLLGVLFVYAGGLKLLLPLAEFTRQLPLPGWFVRFLGVAEVLGGLGLFLPGILRKKEGLTPLAAIGLVLVMVGATVVNLLYAGVGAALTTVAIGLAAGFVAYRRIAARPDAFRVERTQSIQAPADRLFDLIADFHEWAAWSPFEKLDPAMQKTFSGSPSGQGAVYSWAGNRQAGEGRMEILEAARASKVVIRLDFLKPMKAHNTVEFKLEARGGSTAVTWAMYGPQSILCKALSTAVDMDRMIGKQFAAGLGKLKAVAEGQLALTR